jgi:hypothetical protein
MLYSKIDDDLNCVDIKIKDPLIDQLNKLDNKPRKWLIISSVGVTLVCEIHLVRISSCECVNIYKLTF